MRKKIDLLCIARKKQVTLRISCVNCVSIPLGYVRNTLSPVLIIFDRSKIVNVPIIQSIRKLRVV